MKSNKEYVFARMVLKLANQIVKQRNRHVKELGLTAEQADSLQFFLQQEHAVISDLKEYLGVTHQTARGIVQRMEAKGLVYTRQSPTDGRYQIVSPTEHGAAIGQILHENGTQTGSKLLHNMTKEQQETLFSLMKTALHNMESK